MMRVEHESQPRACMACAEVGPTVLLAARSGAGDGAIRLCIRRCFDLLTSTGRRVAASPPGHAETTY